MVSRVLQIIEFDKIIDNFSLLLRNISSEELKWLGDQEEKFQVKDSKVGIAVNFEDYVEQDLLLNEEGILAISPKHFMEKKDINQFNLNLNPSCSELAPKQLTI